ncbi:MAG: hypothetical protein LUD17_14670 [Bacteroidales bacterium]|nr:hypothetical protein [Bacteroidales bacterium]
MDRERLMYDLRNCAWIEGHLMPEEEQHARHTVMDICEPGNIDRVEAMIALACAEAQALIGPLPEAWPIELHEYVLCRVLADWLSIAWPSAAPKWTLKAAEALSSLTGHGAAFTRRLPPM